MLVVFAAVGLVLGAWLVPGGPAPSAAGVSAPADVPSHGTPGVDPAALRAVLHPKAAPDRFAAVVGQARPRQRVALYRRPGAPRPYRRLGPLAHSYDTPLVFLVVGRRPGWLEVALPVRPNHATAWIARPSVRLATTRYRLSVDLRTHRLTAWNGPRRFLEVPIGVGRAVTPTPSGRYFLTDLLRPPDPNGVFGRYAFGLSAYSDVLTSFAGGDGQVGLHGTNDPAGIGTDVSHGCIRVTNPVITRLAHTLPLGTPVTISR